MNQSTNEVRPLSVSECRTLMGWQNRTDEEIAEFLCGLRGFLNQFLDEYYHNELSID